jgi:DNA-binding LacI/PurR family transcriptional regulator
MRRPTSKQVAQLAGVSQTTVSFVLNDVVNANISAETKQRVLEAARQLNYIPDVAARSLARGRNDVIALVLAQAHAQVFIDEYIPRILTGISSVTRQEGFRILVETVEEDNSSLVYQRLLQGKEVAGVIINGFIHQNVTQLVEYTQSGMAIVALGHEHPDLYSVEVDKLSGVRSITQHLIDVGHRVIACIPYDDQSTNIHIQRRLNAFRETLLQNGITPNESLICAGNFEPESGYNAMNYLLDTQPVPDAVFGMNDMMAFGAIRALHERGFRVPHDVAVAGFDDVRLAAFCNPPLTTMHEPDEDHGRVAAEMALKLIHDMPIPNQQITLETQLIIRASCGAVLRS